MRVREMAINAIKQQRAALAGALIVAVLLVGVFHAPLIPVVAGCAAALALKTFSAARSSRAD
jgi:uncharacterized membrane protein YesL